MPMQFIQRHALRNYAHRAVRHRPITLGTLAAGYSGYRVGGTIGGDSGKKVAEAAGTAAGAAAGSAIAKAATKQAGLEIAVKGDDGDVVSVVRAADEAFDEGDPVRVLMRHDGSAGVIQ
ncbi:MAG: hypothetical protein Q8Q12_05445 [bacterium]|nr:hypothetical protein [bacterium]